MAIIGGRAHLNGITFVNNTHIVRGKIVHGRLSIHEHRLPGLRVFNLMDKIPFLRGVSKVAKLNHKLFLASILILIIPWDWLLPSDNLVVSESVWLELAFYGSVLMILVVLLKRLWQFHGAEHKAFNVYMSGGDLSLGAVREASRVSERCGTNLAVIALPIVVLLSLVTMPMLILVVALPIGFEIFNWSSRSNRLKPAFMMASFIQQHIVTAEPTEQQIQLATATLARAIECDLE
ncbi:MAG TPA: DUF1385 domain-containing protein [Desulfosporosinus sp.]